MKKLFLLSLALISMMGHAWSGKYIVVKESEALAIYHTPTYVQIEDSSGYLYRSTYISITRYDSLEFNPPLTLTPDMDREEFERTLEKAGFKIKTRFLNPSSAI